MIVKINACVRFYIKLVAFDLYSGRFFKTNLESSEIYRRIWRSLKKYELLLEMSPHIAENDKSAIALLEFLMRITKCNILKSSKKSNLTHSASTIKIQSARLFKRVNLS